MSRRLPFFGGALAVALIAAGMSGCVDRRFVIDSDPPGAQVYLDGAPLGKTPLPSCEASLGRHVVRMEADGREAVSADPVAHGRVLRNGRTETSR